MEGKAAYMEQRAPRFEALNEANLQATLLSLGISSDDLIEGAEPMLVNTGNSFVVIGIRDGQTVKGLEPDFGLIEKLSEALDLIGFYVFSFDGVGDGRDAGARMFAPRYGILEESATGMAAGPLACYLREQLAIQKQEFTIEQGRWMTAPSPSVINVRLTIGTNNRITNLFASGRGAIRKVIKVDF